MSSVRIGCALAMVLAVGCGESRSPALGAALPSPSEPLALVDPGDTAELRAAYVASRQREGAHDADFHLRNRPDGRYEAPNPRHRFVAELGAGGVRLSSTEGGFELGLTTNGVVCGDGVLDLTLGDASVSLNRIALSGSAGGAKLGEWYVNGPLGLQQGWDVQRPPCEAAKSELVLQIAVTGRSPVASSDGRSIAFAKPGLAIPELHYTDLFARDASGRPLSTRMEVVDSRIAIRVDTAGAKWPVFIDPLVATQEAKFSAAGASDGATNDYFGSGVAVDPAMSFPDIAAIGAPGRDVGGNADQGVIYLFEKVANWGLSAVLVASDGAVGDELGGSVGLSGTTVVAGARKANGQAGAAYVFVRNGAVWSQQQKLTASDAAALDLFGTAVAIDGNTVAVGAPLDDVGANANQGSGYVFVRSGTTWTQQQKVVAGTSPDAQDQFGSAVAVLGNDAAFGAPGNYYTVAGAGGAYVFTRSGTTWAQQQAIFPSTYPSGSSGRSVSLLANILAIGGPGEGAAYVYTRSGTTWSLQQKQTKPADAYNFGWSTALFNASNPTLAVGADTTNVALASQQGATYVYRRSGATWPLEGTLIASDGLAGDRLGYSVSGAGNTVLTGAFQDDVGGSADRGSAYLWTRVVSTWSQGQKLVAAEGVQDELMGQAVAIDGNTALVGVPHDTVNGVGWQGSVFVYVKSGATWSQQARIVASDGGASDEFGSAVALSGNTALVGAPGDAVTAGSAYVFVRSGSVWSQQQKLTVAGAQESDRLGESVAISADTALLGMPGDGAASQGAAFVFVRSGTVWSQQQKLAASDAAATDNFGAAVGLTGNDAVVGAPLADISGKIDEGAAYVFVRSGTTWSQQQKLTAPSGAAGDELGRAVAIFGSDVLVGAPKDDVGTTDRGSALVFGRAGTTWTYKTQLLAGTGSTGDAFGSSVALGADVAAVGAALDDVSAMGDAGSVQVFVRDATGAWAEQAPAIGPSDSAASDRFGSAVSLSSDGLLVGAPGKSFELGTDIGAAYVVRLKGLVGQSCVGTSDCAGGLSCMDNVCCKSACGGVCEVCSAVKGATQNGTCTPLPANGSPQPAKGSCGVLCNGTSGACPSGCQNDSNCEATKYCDQSGACVPRKANGVACNLAAGADCLLAGCRACTSNQCVDGVCCDSACNGGPCDTCAQTSGASANGTCTTLAKGAPPAPPGCPGFLCAGGSAACPSTCAVSADCATGYFCSAGSCVPKKSQGSDCSAQEQCGSGLSCSDGVCCNAQCTSKCEACKAANKESGADSGICGAAKKGTNPGSHCVKAADPCGEQATCSGVVGQCALAAATTSCGPTTCNGTAVSGKICDGNGSCVDQTNAQCSPYVCQAGACTSPCAVDANCISNPAHYCQGGFCVPKIDNGKACQAANQCTSSFCVDGVCCDSPCTGQCESCAETGSVGQCKPRAGAPKAPKAACAGTGACVGQCDGANPNACVLPGASTQCSASSCTGDSLTPPGTCDSAGGCSVPVPKSCAPYACSAGACKLTCANDGDCAAGATCDTNKGLCAVSGATCTDAFTVKQPNGQTQSCSPYKCVGGACQQQCVNGNDCATGYDCVASSCVPKDGGAGGSGGGTAGSAGSAGSGGATSDAGPDAGGATSGGEGSDEGGCGCKLAGATPARLGPTWLSGLVIAALGWRRRRSRARI